ncbi:hypothetical protein N7471_010999 [Penicillium samsonianum]|uniref:uncharacterized protein n=1 Tax=Penicillium samsonianum TaxID=1882272 RepID=UPI002546DA24|nr:uncharacterized protein N7471_010999 [Penicillium samsonianum]KAJ6123682.1 hypothetical protein N7471_010999 [Penicillium samsonianum]
MPPRAIFPRAAKPAGKAAPKKPDGKRKKGGLNGDAEAPPPKKKTKKEIPQVLDEELLAADLNIDYSKKGKKLRPQMPKKQQWGKVKGVITERENAPKGWNPEEPDLMPDDFESQIERCLERIEENIMPHVYQHKMNEFMAKQAALMGTEPGLSWPVVQRLDDLKFTLNWLVTGNDEYKMVDTVKAIIAHYRSCELDWNPDFVTYWHAGVQLCLPRPFYWDEYRYIHDKCEGHVGFWVEGVLGHAPGISKTSMVRLSLRIPQDPPVAVKKGDDGKNRKDGKDEKDEKPPPRPPSFEFPFMDDTGSTHMSMFEDDINLLRNMGANDGHIYPLPRCLGVGVLYVADGRRVTSLFRELEVNMWSTDESAWMSPYWQAIPASIQSGQATRVGADRLSGSWLRHRFYTGTCPDQSMRLWVFNYNPGIPQGQRTLPTATSAQLTASFRIGRLHPVTDFQSLF